MVMAMSMEIKQHVHKEAHEAEHDHLEEIYQHVAVAEYESSAHLHVHVIAHHYGLYEHAEVEDGAVERRVEDVPVLSVRVLEQPSW